VPDDQLNTSVGLSVRRARQEHGLSQEALADAAGLDRAYLSGLERGKRNPTLASLAKIAAALGLPLHELVKEAEERD
jgi:transcriptional regulator with XRE-family HTH domain